MTTYYDRLKLGFQAFKEAFLTSAVVDTEDWSEQAQRQLRYNILWAWYEQTNYRDIHQWTILYRQSYGLYKYIRPIYNPAYRLGEFWKAHLFGGLLSIVAAESGAIPISTDSETLRLTIAEVWKWSRWQVQKDILTVRGAILGDACIRVVDDVNRERVYLDLLHPGLLESVELDPFGNCKGYCIKETVVDPRKKFATVEYMEKVSRSGDDVIYETFLNGIPYAWPENVDRTGEPVAAWSAPYGFVPLVVIQHNDVGLSWGWSELHPIRGKVQEVDDLASLISDQVRKIVDPTWLMKGMKTAPVNLTKTAATSARPMPGREEMGRMWGVPKEASAEAMVTDLRLEPALLHLDSILKEIERDVLELSQDIHTASGDASGRALRTARQPVASKVVLRRANYDAGLVAAQQMAIAIGGFRKYDGYAGFNLDSYARGDLDHTIAARSVFDEDPLDVSEIDAAFWDAAGKAKKAGVPLEGFLKEAGWDDERIAELLEEVEPGPVSYTLLGTLEETEDASDEMPE